MQLMRYFIVGALYRTPNRFKSESNKEYQYYN